MINNDGYRRGVGVMLINADKQIWVGARIDNDADAWQMPQGGIDAGEDPWQAAQREVEEETGIAPHLIERVAYAACQRSLFDAILLEHQSAVDDHRRRLARLILAFGHDPAALPHLIRCSPSSHRVPKRTSGAHLSFRSCPALVKRSRAKMIQKGER